MFLYKLKYAFFMCISSDVGVDAVTRFLWDTPTYCEPLLYKNIM